MRRTRDLALQTGLYVAAAISGVAAAYILKEYMLHFWDSWTRDRSVCNDSSDRDHDSESKYESRINPTLPCPTNDTTVSPSEPAVVVPRGETRPSAHAGAPAQTRTLQPLRTHSLTPPPPNAQLILSGAHPDTTSLSHITSPTTRSSSLRTWSVVSSEDESTAEDSDGDGDGLGVSSPVSESLVQVLSPHPTQEVTRRHSVRAHDVFAASHISFSELGSLVSTDSQPS